MTTYLFGHVDADKYVPEPGDFVSYSLHRFHHHTFIINLDEFNQVIGYLPDLFYLREWTYNATDVVGYHHIGMVVRFRSESDAVLARLLLS